ncbi:hypothetical protein SK128_003945 [Halocaridina rubra]|uniref:Uncharacterized protein n=1 Tax=Halocaridina rubra TaxID=373956 RepID=A0AAN9A9L0_HALRR
MSSADSNRFTIHKSLFTQSVLNRGGHCAFNAVIIHMMRFGPRRLPRGRSTSFFFVSMASSARMAVEEAASFWLLHRRLNRCKQPFDPASGVGDCAALTMNATLLKLDCGTRLHFKSSRQDSWHDASIECEIDSGYLITISGDLEQQYATDFAIESHDQVWTGLTEEVGKMELLPLL